MITSAVKRKPIGDAVGWLTVYIFVLLLIPSRLIVGPLGSAGTPSMLLGLGSLLLWLLLFLGADRRMSPDRQPIRVALGILVVCIGVSYVLAMSRPMSPDEISPADVAILSLASWCGTLLLAHDGVRDRRSLETLIWRLTIAGGIVAVLGIVQLLTRQLWVDQLTIPGLSGSPGYGLAERGGFPRPAGTAIHPIEYGVLLTMILPLALHVGFHHTERRPVIRWLPGCALLLIIPLTSSRSAYIGALIAIAICMFGWSAQRRLRALGIGAVGLVAMIVLTPNFFNSIMGLFTGASDDPSVTSRTDSASVAAEFFTVHPWFGRGLGTFLPKYRIFDNQYLLLIVSIGLVGTLAFLALGIAAIMSTFRLRRRVQDGRTRDLAVALCSAICVGMTCLFMFDAFAFPMTMGTLMLIIGMSGALARTESFSESHAEVGIVPANPIEVAAVIVTYNSERYIVHLLDSIPAAMAELRYSLVIVDNGSTDATLTILNDRTDCIVIRSTNNGYASGINLAVRSSPTAPAILILNPDAMLDPNSVPAMLKVLSRSGVGVVAPRVREADGSLSPTLRRGPSMARVGGLSFTGWPTFTERIEDPRDYENEHEVAWAVGAILLIDAACYHSLAGIDESYFLYSEEADFSLRAKDTGWATVYTPTAGAMHVGGGSGESAATHTMKIVNRIRLYRRRRGTARAWIYFVLMVLTETRRAILGHDKSWPTVRALLRPSTRPAVLGAGDRLLPR